MDDSIKLNKTYKRLLDKMTQQAPAGGKDWRKFVTVDPPASLSFMLYPEDTRPPSWLSLINKSDQNIIFKVKTTKPMSYLVRPSQGIISPNSNSKVTVLFNHKLDSEVSNSTRTNAIAAGGEQSDHGRQVLGPACPRCQWK